MTFARPFTGAVEEETSEDRVNVEIMVGGGMRDFPTTCYLPCLCEHCRRVVQGNLLAEQKRCARCKGKEVIPYDDPKLLASEA